MPYTLQTDIILIMAIHDILYYNNVIKKVG